jgi:Family of unknown function (DUF5947)
MGMTKTDELRGMPAFGMLRQFARKPENVEHCELCHAALHAEHPHLLEPGPRKILCSCDACAMLFSSRADAKYKRVPRDIRRLANFRMTDAQWDGLMIPINLAFFFKSGLDSRVKVLYPSPAGATESLLPLEAWTSIAETSGALRNLEPDVEALLVNRVGEARGAAPAEYYIAPIDACYKLVGLIRLHWRGLSGGTEVWQEIGGFFADLRVKAHVANDENASEGTHA